MPRSAAVVSTLLAALVLAAPAGAATAITSPADGTALVGDATFAVTGTANGEPAIELRCGSKWGDDTWHYTQRLEGAENVPVAGGAWSVAGVTVPAEAIPCRLFAFPAGMAPANNTTFDPRESHSGPRLRIVTASVRRLASGTHFADVVGADLSFGGLEAIAYGGTLGTAGMSTQMLGPDPLDDGAGVFSDANELRMIDPESPETSGSGTELGLRVDGVNAYVGGTWIDSGGDGLPFNGYDGLPTVTAAASVAADGAAVTTEVDRVRRCLATDPSTWPLGGFTCNAIGDPGVTLGVTTTVTPRGTRIRRDWTIASNDAAEHAVHLAIQHPIDVNGASARQWRFPGGDYAARATGELVTPPAVPFSVEVRRSGAPEPDPQEGYGAVTFAAAPTTLRYSGPRDLVAIYDVTVPAGGAVTLPFVLSSDESQAALTQDVASAEAPFRPESPGGGEIPGGGEEPSGGEPSGGNGPDGGTAPGVGTPGGPSAPGGPAAPGRPGAPAKPAAPRLRWRGAPKLAGGRLAIGATLACPGRGPSCTAALTLRAKRRTLAKGTVVVAAGRTLALTLRVPHAKATLRRLRPTLVVAPKRGAVKAKAVTRRLRLR